MSLERRTVLAMSTSAEAEPPMDCLLELIRLIKEGKAVTPEFFIHLLHVVSYIADRIVLTQNTPDHMTVKPYGIVSFDAKLLELVTTMGEVEADVKGLDPTFLYRMALELLLKMLPKLLSPYLTADAIQMIVDALQSVLDSLLAQA